MITARARPPKRSVLVLVMGLAALALGGCAGRPLRGETHPATPLVLPASPADRDLASPPQPPGVPAAPPLAADAPAARPPGPESPAATVPPPDLEELAETVRRDPRNPDARLALGTALAARRELARAIPELREGLRLLEEDGAPEGATARSHLEKGQTLIARGDMAGAVPVLRRALLIDPGLVAARVGLGVALYGLGNVDGAIDELRLAVRQDPEDTGARLGLAAALIARQDWATARVELEAVLQRDPVSQQAHAGLGIVRYAMGDLTGAIEAYRRILARDPEAEDARYGLGLLLKLARRDAEATAEFLAAARGGVPKAQYFAGAAYAAGSGVPRDLAAAIRWWFRAAEQGVAQAEEALAQLRQIALGKTRRRLDERQAAGQAFREFRAELWTEFPALIRGADATVGAALLETGRVTEAVPVLIREALALSEPAHELLETIYVDGVAGAVPAHDPRILGYFRMAAADGLVRARLALARIYARGLGVPPDLAGAVSLLRATPHEDARRMLHELAATNRPGPIGP